MSYVGGEQSAKNDLCRTLFAELSLYVHECYYCMLTVSYIHWLLLMLARAFAYTY
jgi:hypothetical protein